MRGAGGTDGGIGRFFLGFVMVVGGGYLFFHNIRVHTPHWGLGSSLYQFAGLNVTTGLLLVPFVLGIGIVFYSGSNPAGWMLAAGSVVAMGIGVLASLQIRLADMSLFELLSILVLMVGGAGILLSSLRDRAPPTEEEAEG